MKAEIENQRNKIKEKENELKSKDQMIIEQKSKIELAEKEKNDYRNKYNLNEDEINKYKEELRKTKENMIKANRTGEREKELLLKLEENKKDYERKKETIKKEYERAFEEKYKKEIDNKIKKINDVLKEKMQESNAKLKLEFEKRYTQKENDLSKKLEEMSQLILKSNINQKGNNNNNLKMSICDTIHYDIMCNNCYESPIFGYRYKCSICPNYNLCQKCEEENSMQEFHKHDFIKLRKYIKYNNNDLNNNDNNFNNNVFNINNNNNGFNINNNNNFNDNYNNKYNNINDNKGFNYNDDNNNLINNYVNENENNINNNYIGRNNDNNFGLFNGEENGEGEEEYSYQCDNTLLLSIYIFEGTDEGKIKLNISNNGNKPWPEQTKLKFDEKSLIKGKEVRLNPQKPGTKESYEIVYPNLKGFKAGEYRSNILFNVNGKNYGEVLTIKVVIKGKEKPKNEFEEHKEKIKDFRDNFGLSEIDYSDEKLYEILKSNDFDYGKTFEALFN